MFCCLGSILLFGCGLLGTGEHLLFGYGGTVANVRFKLRGLRFRLSPGGIYGMFSSPIASLFLLARVIVIVFLCVL